MLFLRLSAAALLARGTNRSDFDLVLRLKLEFHNSAALGRGRFEFPLLHGIHGGIDQDRMPATGFELFTVPLGATTTANFTVPVMLMRRATSG